MKTGERVGNAFLTKNSDEERENLLAKTTEKGTLIAGVFEVTRADDDVGVGLDGGLIELSGFGGNVLSVRIKLNGVVIAFGGGIFETCLDRPGVAKIENIVDARYVMFGNDFTSGVG